MIKKIQIIDETISHAKYFTAKTRKYQTIHLLHSIQIMEY